MADFIIAGQSITISSTAPGFAQDSTNRYFLSAPPGSTRTDSFTITFADGAAIRLTDFNEIQAQSSSSVNVIGIPQTAENNFTNSVNIIGGLGGAATFDIFDANSGNLLLDNFEPQAFVSGGGFPSFTPFAFLGYNSSSDVLTIQAPRNIGFIASINSQGLGVFTSTPSAFVGSAGTQQNQFISGGNLLPWQFSLTGGSSGENTDSEESSTNGRPSTGPFRGFPGAFPGAFDGRFDGFFGGSGGDNTPADEAPGATDLQPTDLDGDGFRENKQSRDGLLVDANLDGVADYLQPNVIGIRLINDGAAASDYGALLPAPGVKISELSFTPFTPGGTLPVVTRAGARVNATIPAGTTNALAGALSFNLSGVTPGGTTQLTLALPAGLQPAASNAYLRFNYATNRFEDYLDFQGKPLYLFVDTDRDGNVDAIKLTLIDGDSAWDRDGLANGTIVDPGFPASGERNLVGTNRKDSLIGNALANTINGKNNDDVLVGDLGPDLLIGAAGKDRYVYTRADESTPAQRDTIELDSDDRLVFSSFDADTTTDGLQKLTFIGKQAFSGVAGELRATRSLLEADVNGDAVADFAVNLRGSGLITSNSLVL